MKASFIVPVIISILLGALCGKLVFDQYRQKEEVFNEQNQIYFLQQGVYSTKESYEENTQKLESKVLVIEDGKYYCYVGMTKNSKNAEKIKKLYSEMGYSLYIKESTIDNKEFSSSLEQYDVLLDAASKNDEIKSVLKVILSSYEEMNTHQ